MKINKQGMGNKSIYFIIYLLFIFFPEAEGFSADENPGAGEYGPLVAIMDISGRRLGGGFVANSSGDILTCYTVVAGNPEVAVEFAGGGRIKGKVKRVDGKNNLALIETNNKELSFMNLGDSGFVRDIDKVTVPGYPAEGMVYSIQRAEELKRLGSSRKTDPFNSLMLFKVSIKNPERVSVGSPLLNTKEEVVGVNALVSDNFLYSIEINKVFESFPEDFTEDFEPKDFGRKGKFEVRRRGIRYAMYVPSYYDSRRKWPLILAFHPGGDGGEIRDFWVDHAERGGFIVACGYTAQGDIWKTYDDYRIFRMLKNIFRCYNIEKNRVFLTGLSGGAVFSYYLGINYSELFSALAAVTSGSISQIDSKLDYSSGRSLPILAVHGDRDTVVPVSIAKRDIDKLRKHGYRVSYKEIKGMGHDHRTHKDEIYRLIIDFFNRRG